MFVLWAKVPASFWSVSRSCSSRNLRLLGSKARLAIFNSLYLCGVLLHGFGVPVEHLLSGTLFILFFRVVLELFSRGPPLLRHEDDAGCLHFAVRGYRRKSGLRFLSFLGKFTYGELGAGASCPAIFR